MKKTISLITLVLIATTVLCQPKLSSYPQAKATVYLDFDGHFVTATPWNGGQSFYCEPAGLNDAQITEIFLRVSEDFRPFDINVTTDSTVYEAAPLVKRIRIVVTPTSAWYPGVGGVSFNQSFTWGDETPAFVFPDRLSWKPKSIAECCSHETGHTLGLSHQAKYDETCSLQTVYNQGVGSGETGWAPIMGNSYSRNLSSWNNGPTPSGCYADQDNLSIITGTNGFGYRADDHRNDPRNGATVLSLAGDTFDSEGLISQSDDTDAFEVNLSQPGALTLKVLPFAVGPQNAGANLDIKVVLMNDKYEEINTYDPADKLDVEIDTTMNKGKYFILVQGTGNKNATSYGSLGSYTMNGNLRPLGPLPIRLLALKGTSNGGSHKLTWDLICDEQIVEQDVMVSYNGRDFKNIASVSPDDRQFVYNPLQSGEVYYRIKVVSEVGEVSYSNIISLKQASSDLKIALRSNLVTDQIEINAEQQYRFILSDMNGKILRKGAGSAGHQSIDISNSPHGIYILQIISNSQRITQRVVKL